MDPVTAQVMMILSDISMMQCIFALTGKRITAHSAKAVSQFCQGANMRMSLAFLHN